MRVPFYQVNTFLYAEEYLPKSLSTYKPEISFENYVKSQVHCCMTGRNIRDYVDTLKLIKGEDTIKNRKAFKKVLNYYYKDLTNVMSKHKDLINADFNFVEDPIPALEKLKSNPIDDSNE